MIKKIRKYAESDNEYDGICHHNRSKCPKGCKGDRGRRGCPGEPGPTGEKGEKGNKGKKGDTGMKGDKGDIGPTGMKGDKGDIGPTGMKGDKGDIGPTGMKGNVGPTGMKGGSGRELHFSDDSSGNNTRFMGQGDSSSGNDIGGFLEVAYIVCDTTTVSTFIATVKDNTANIKTPPLTVTFKFYAIACPSGTISLPVTPTAEVVVTPTSSSSANQHVAFCNTATFGPVTLSPGDLVAVLVAPDEGLGSLSAAASIC